MWPFKSKFQKLKREDVVDAIISLEKEQSSLEEEIVSSQAKIDKFMEMGKKEKARDLKVFYAKKINSLKDERAQKIKRVTYLMYNVKLLEKLKASIDDNQFFSNNSKLPFSKLLADQKGLAKFLNSALQTRVNAENVLTEADDLFVEVEGMYEENQAIYGVKDQDDELLAMFETEEQVDLETADLDGQVAASDLEAKEDTKE